MTDELPEKVDPVEETPEEEQKGDDSLLVLVAMAGLGAFLWYVNKRQRETGSSPAAFSTSGNTAGIGGRVEGVGIAALDAWRAKYGPLPHVNVNPGMILPNAKVEWGNPGGEKLH